MKAKAICAVIAAGLSIAANAAPPFTITPGSPAAYQFFPASAATPTTSVPPLVAEGDPCADSGAIGRDSAGVLLSCQSGVWIRYVKANGDTMTGRLSFAADDWGIVLRNGAGADNAQPQNSIGSAYVNDIYIRSIGKWASQLNTPGLAGVTCPSGQVVYGFNAAGSPICSTPGVGVGGVSVVGFGVWACPGRAAFVYAHKQSSGAALQGVTIQSNWSGQIAISTGQSEGHLGYQTASGMISAGECFMVQDVGGGMNRFAYYRTL